MGLEGFLYKEYFYPANAEANLIISTEYRQNPRRFILDVVLQANIPYILVVTTTREYQTGEFTIAAYDSSSTIMNRINISNVISTVQSTYTSLLNENSQKFQCISCARSLCFSMAISISAAATGLFHIDVNSTIEIDMYLYRHELVPFNQWHNFDALNEQRCSISRHQIIRYLLNNTEYTLLVMASEADTAGKFSITSYGPSTISFVPKNYPTTFNSKYRRRSSTPKAIRQSAREKDKTDYNTVQISVNTTGYYKIIFDNRAKIRGTVYLKNWNPLYFTEDSHNGTESTCGSFFMIKLDLQANLEYVLILYNIPGFGSETSISIQGPGAAVYEEMEMKDLNYTSALTTDSATYSRICRTGSYHYETIEIIVQQNGNYGFGSSSSIILYGYIYENKFNPFQPDDNLLMSSNHTRLLTEFEIVVHLQMNVKYILVVTTSLPYTQGSFSIYAVGPSNFSLNRVSSEYDDCMIGDQCNLHIRAIGLTLDDIFYNKIRPNISLNEQSSFVKITAAVTMIMFAAGLVNGILSILTFQNAELRNVGCGVYLLASSFTSLLTISLFTIKFWLFLFVEIDINKNSFMIGAHCLFVEPFLKISLYLDGWLNACVAIERTVAVYKQVQFDKKKSKFAAQWIILCLSIVITGTFIHEPLHRSLFEYQTQTYKVQNSTTTSEEIVEYDLVESSVTETTTSPPGNESEPIEYILDQTVNHYLCIVKYSSSIQKYNVFILYLHILFPFLANLFSALCIIFETARQRSTTQRRKSYKSHVFKQMSQHKQLLISPIIILVLSLPRLIIVLIPGCINPSDNQWFYIFGYFSSFIPSMLIFIIFVVPSKLYRNKLKETLKCRRRRR